MYDICEMNAAILNRIIYLTTVHVFLQWMDNMISKLWGLLPPCAPSKLYITHYNNAFKLEVIVNFVIQQFMIMIERAEI